MNKMTIAALAGLSLAATTPVFAAELVTNGDFEASPSGSEPAGFDVEPGDEIVTIVDTAYGACCGATGLTGNQFASFGSGDQTNVSTLTQALGTIAGQSYAVSFLFGTFGSTPQALTVNIRSVTSGLVISTFGFTPDAGGTNFANIFQAANFSFLADGGTSIEFNVDPGTASYDGLLDNVSVMGAVPEPATWGMMILGFGVVGGALRSRRRQTVRLAYS